MEDYRTAIGVARFVSFVGWVAVTVGGISAVVFLTQVSGDGFGGFGIMRVLGIFGSILFALVGLLLVIGGQASRAVMDNVNCSKEMLAEMKRVKN